MRVDPLTARNLISVVRVLGYPVTNVTMEEAVALIESFLGEPRLHHVVIVNTNKMWLAGHTPKLSEILHRAEMLVTEYGPVWASKILGNPLKANIRGVGLLKTLLPWLETQRIPVYFLGGHEVVLRTVLAKLQISHPKLTIAGARNGYFEKDEEASIVDHINKSGAAILFVGMGSPRQEFFVEKYRNVFLPRVAMGVGGSFDVLAGIKRDAPAWTQHGVEWIYRLWQDPQNLWKRYLRAHPWFIYHVMREKFVRAVNFHET